MRTYRNLWPKVTDADNIRLAVRHACKGKGGQMAVARVRKDMECYAKKTRDLLLSGGFHTSEYHTFMQHYPKDRLIYSLPVYPDRIVHHALLQVMIPCMENLFLPTIYACIKGRGQLSASIKCSENVRRYRWCVDCDIRRYHENINPMILSEQLHSKFNDTELMRVVDDIVLSHPWMPTGNYTSQWFSNFYLIPFDNAVKHVLKCPAYERYMDNFLLFTDSREQAEEWSRIIPSMLAPLGLWLSHNAIRDCKQGVYLTGYRHFGKYVLLRKKTARTQRRYVTRCAPGYANVQSMRGWDIHACTYNFRQSIKLDETCAALKGT